jgi:hypothetical protein
LIRCLALTENHLRESAPAEPVHIQTGAPDVFLAQFLDVTVGFGCRQ